MKKIFLLFILTFFFSCKNDNFISIEGESKELNSLIGLNVFDIIYYQSKANPETLIGTNNNRWVVYLDDINVTLETEKKSDIIVKASVGKNPKSNSWAN